MLIVYSAPCVQPNASLNSQESPSDLVSCWPLSIPFSKYLPLFVALPSAKAPDLLSPSVWMLIPFLTGVSNSSSFEFSWFLKKRCSHVILLLIKTSLKAGHLLRGKAYPALPALRAGWNLTTTQLASPSWCWVSPVGLSFTEKRHVTLYAWVLAPAGPSFRDPLHELVNSAGSSQMLLFPWSLPPTPPVQVTS